MREVHDTKDEQKTEETKAYSKDGTDLIEIDEMLKPHEGNCDTGGRSFWR